MDSERADQDTIRTVLTCQGTDDRLTARPPLSFGRMSDESMPSVSVDTQVRYQTIEGFGGAFTEAAAVTLAKLPADVREEILTACFDGAAGHGYTLCRTHINSCDFSTGNFAYTEVDGDTALEHFSIERDRQARLPMIRRAIQIAGPDADFKLFASPWSPPAWMKTNGQMNQGGKLKAEYREAWAWYYCRFVREYEAEGVPIWGLTVQNEPQATQRWDSCVYTAQEERDFVRDTLGPTLVREGLGELRLMIHDHNRDALYERAKVIYDDPEAARYVWGAAFHWYAGDNFDNVQLVHDAWPEKKLLFTEGCQEQGTHLRSWALGERYGRSIVNDLNRWAVGWVDWNLLLDEAGGPNHVDGFCSAAIIANTRTGKPHYQSAYYYLGHFSRYIRPGAQRVLCATSRDALEATAFENTDGTVAVVVMNRTGQAIGFALKHAGRAALMDIPAHSIMTMTFEAV